MARQKSEFVSAFGTAFEVFMSLSDEVLSLGGNDEQLRRIISDREVRHKLAEVLVGNSSVTTTSNATTYPVTINYDDTFEQRLAAGRYDWKNSDINQKNFPVKGEGIVERNLELAHYGKVMSTDAVLAAIDATGYRSATIEELLAFGAKYPELQREFPIVALGSVWQCWNGRRRVAFLDRYADGRRLDLYWLESGWDAFDRFLVVRK